VPRPARRFACLLLAAALAASFPALAADDSEADALALESAPVESPTAAPTSKLFVEGAIGAADGRREGNSRGLARMSIDFFHTARLAPGLQVVISDRLDAMHPADIGQDHTVNSLREAYVSWQQPGGRTGFDLGRMNLRHGPAYGYNPTDFFRDDSLRTMTTVNPLSLRENRLGTFVVRGQQLWTGGSLAVAYSPKLADRPSSDGTSLDFGATNNRDRGLVTLGSQIAEKVSGQLLLYKDSNLPVALGASVTALLSDAMVGYAEFSRSREPDLLQRAQDISEPRSTRNRFAGGLTYTTASKLSITGEYQYNGFALDRAGWDQLSASGPNALGGYLLTAQRRQELASRQAYLIYATQKSLFLKNLDLTALLRTNVNDHSRLGWLELRYHWPRWDLALQLQQQNGVDASEYGLAPYRRSVQLLLAYYFQ
jgi:hypothetical protein